MSDSNQNPDVPRNAVWAKGWEFKLAKTSALNKILLRRTGLEVITDPATGQQRVQAVKPAPAK